MDLARDVGSSLPDGAQPLFGEVREQGGALPNGRWLDGEVADGDGGGGMRMPSDGGIKFVRSYGAQHEHGNEVWLKEETAKKIADLYNQIVAQVRLITDDDVHALDINLTQRVAECYTRDGRQFSIDLKPTTEDDHHEGLSKQEIKKHLDEIQKLLGELNHDHPTLSRHERGRTGPVGSTNMFSHISPEVKKRLQGDFHTRSERLISNVFGVDRNTPFADDEEKGRLYEPVARMAKQRMFHELSMTKINQYIAYLKGQPESEANNEEIRKANELLEEFKAADLFALSCYEVCSAKVKEEVKAEGVELNDTQFAERILEKVLNHLIAENNGNALDQNQTDYAVRIAALHFGTRQRPAFLKFLRAHNLSDRETTGIEGEFLRDAPRATMKRKQVIFETLDPMFMRYLNQEGFDIRARKMGNTLGRVSAGINTYGEFIDAANYYSTLDPNKMISAEEAEEARADADGVGGFERKDPPGHYDALNN